MALDSATSALLQQMAATGAKPMHEVSPGEARERMAALARLFPQGPALPRVERRAIASRDSERPALVLAPAEPRGIILYLHGGGWVVGSIEENEALGRVLADRTGCTVVLASYRLAPEHQWPAAVEDAWAALEWTAAHRAELAGADLPLIVAGDSAGGNLATIVARKARDAGGPEVSLQVLVYPVTDHDFDNSSYADPANQLALNRQTMAWFWDHYVAKEDRDHPDVSPSRASDLTSLPPAVVVTAEHDCLRDEGETYAEQLREAGVPVASRRFEGQMHGFFTMVGLLPGNAAALDYVVDHIDSHLETGRDA